jgi:hypothetical protein
MLQPADHEQELPACGVRHDFDPSPRRKKKNQKERTVERGRLWKLSQPRKSSQVAFGNILLMISSAAWKTLLGFPQLPQAQLRRLTLKPLTIRVDPFCSIGVGSFYVVKSSYRR